MEKVVLSIAEFMKLVPLCRNSVYQGMRRGEIAYIKIGRRYFIPVDVVDRMLKSEGKEKANIGQSIGR